VGVFGAFVLVLITVYVFMRVKNSKISGTPYDDGNEATFIATGSNNPQNVKMQEINGVSSAEYAVMDMQPSQDPLNRVSNRSFEAM